MARRSSFALGPPPTGVGARLAWRLAASVRTLPGARGWLESAGLLAGYALVAAPVALLAGLAGPRAGPVEGVGLPLALRVLVAPALLEEVVFRVLPTPRPEERPGARARLLWTVASLVVYVLAHPLVAWVARPAALPVFARPAFLALAALLGLVTLLAYLRTRSLWPGTLLHALVVLAWLGLGGAGLLAE